MGKLPIEIENPIFGLKLYPTADEIRVAQQDVMWTSEEIPVADDLHDFRHNMSEEQFNLASIILSSFVETEQIVGNIWNTMAEVFPHSEIDGACTVIAAMEKGVHANFYQQMADVMNLESVEAAEQQANIRSINNKMTYLKGLLKNIRDDKQMALAAVSFIEQVLLFSNFAMLKSFQANGYSLIPNTITGVKFVIQDK